MNPEGLVRPIFRDECLVAPDLAVDEDEVAHRLGLSGRGELGGQAVLEGADEALTRFRLHEAGRVWAFGRREVGWVDLVAVDHADDLGVGEEAQLLLEVAGEGVVGATALVEEGDAGVEPGGVDGGGDVVVKHGVGEGEHGVHWVWRGVLVPTHKTPDGVEAALQRAEMEVTPKMCRPPHPQRLPFGGIVTRSRNAFFGRRCWRQPVEQGHSDGREPPKLVTVVHWVCGNEPQLNEPLTCCHLYSIQLRLPPIDVEGVVDPRCVQLDQRVKFLATQFSDGGFDKHGRLCELQPLVWVRFQGNFPDDALCALGELRFHLEAAHLDAEIPLTPL